MLSKMCLESIAHKTQFYSQAFLPFQGVCLWFCNVYSKQTKLQLSPAVIKLTTDAPGIILSAHNKRESNHV